MIKIKIIKKLILFCIFSITLLSTFLIPKAYAQEWTYEGADTESIPDFSVFPSEWYMYNVETSGVPSDIIFCFEITHGNITNYMMKGNGTGVWSDLWIWDINSGEKILGPKLLLSYWNETVGFNSTSFPCIIPVENDGKVSTSILGFVSLYSEMYFDLDMENQFIYADIYSIAFWNESYNDAYMYFNWTDDGILTGWESYSLVLEKLLLYSQPAQLPPVFSFTTEHDTLIIDSTDTDLKVAITDADNNNDGSVDTDYLYRIFYDSTWTSWAPIPTLIDFDFGSVPAGNYTVTMEVKNMYGVTQKQIEIQYEPSGDGGVIPGYSIILIIVAFLLVVSILIHKNHKKL